MSTATPSSLTRSDENDTKRQNVHKLINDALIIESETAKDAGAIGFMAWALVQATLPHRKHTGAEFTRTNGNFTISLLSPSSIGLPYGSIPRLLVSWVATEAVRTQSRELVLGGNLSEFMSKLDLVPTGGRWGTIKRLKEQMRRLFATSITCIYDNDSSWALDRVHVADSARLWWDPQHPDQSGLWESTLTLGENFFNEIIERPVPVDLRALKALRRSPMALDIYCWLTYRMSYVRRPVVVSWSALQAQFGAEYGRPRDFRKKFLEQLKAVSVVYPEAKIDSQEQGLLLRPSKPHISKV